MDDPIQTYDFIKEIIDAKHDEIVGLAIPKGNRLTLSKGKSKYTYVFSLLLIMGPWHFIKTSLKTIIFKVRKKLYRLGVAKDPTIAGYALSKGIPTQTITTPNSKKFRDYLVALNLDVIINQSQNIIKKELLDIPKIGVLNRHNALLPKNRGRLTPFWVAFNGEEETGVSIHFVEEGIDSGDIIVQKKYKVTKKDNFNSIVKKNYTIAAKAMIEALEILESKEHNFINNDDDIATYNTTPSLKEAFAYRKKRIRSVYY
ncbi:formyltransferase family protein [Aureibaculum sp. 2210JD6-5]|uniref:formyltransferase family protein n=1 Tax=Aureibaculum sp. 2210JD6-5 TaxID=3103957 RepID=UPI002ABE457B|nr:formyltransferase family protein [Aureibaculum sp. 2210JD6-5]